MQVREFSRLTKQRHREPHVACLARSIGGAGATMRPPSGSRANSVAMAERSARGLLVPRFFVTSGGLMTRRCVSDGPGLGKTCNLSEARHARKSYTPKAASPIRTCWPMNVNGWGISLAAMEAAAGSIVAARLIVQDHVQTRSWLITTAAAWKFIA